MSLEAPTGGTGEVGKGEVGTIKMPLDSNIPLLNSGQWTPVGRNLHLIFPDEAFRA